MMIYQPYDVRDFIEEKKPADLVDLNTWEIPNEVKGEITMMTRSVLTGGKNYLANKAPFVAAFGINVNTYITYKMQAPMAVNIAMGKTSLTPRLNLYVNPLWLFYKLGNVNEPFVDNESFDDIACLLMHEYSHLLYDHHSQFDYYLKHGYGEIVNIATDCQINQQEMIARNKNLTSYGITLDSVKRYTNNPNLKPKDTSKYYFDEMLSNSNQSQNNQNSQGQQGSGSGSVFGGAQSSGENSNNQAQKNGSPSSSSNKGDEQSNSQNGGKSQSGDGDPLGQKESHKVWNNTPDDCKGDAGDQPANADAAEKALADAVQNAMEMPGINADKARGLVAGNILDRMLTGESKKGKLPIKSVLLRGAGRLKMGERRTYRKINPKQGNRIDIRRGKVEENGKNIHCFLDNSGSMGEFEINWAMSEIAAVAKKVKAKLEVYPFDTKVYAEHKQYADRNGKYHFTPVGRGGTSFQPVFDYLHDKTRANNRDDLIIILTDGYGESQVDTHNLNNVIWLLVEEKRNTLSVKDPVGKVAWLDQDEKYHLHKLGN